MIRMLCRIADLYVDVPEAGGMAPRCTEYLCQTEQNADIVILAEQYRPHYWPNLRESAVAYLDSGVQFYMQLLDFNGLMLHASAVELDGRAYLFSGPCGMGKSTHTRLWQEVFGSRAQVFNDDKPALRLIDGRWYAYGTPWCGKDGINQNKKVPLAGICFLKRGQENDIRRLTNKEAVSRIIWQTMKRFQSSERMDVMLRNVDRLVRDIPVFELKNLPEQAAARLSYETMSRAAEDTGYMEDR